MDDLVSAILQGDTAAAISRTDSLVANGVTSDDIVVNAIERAMTMLDAKCTAEHFNLLEIMLSGRAATEVMKVLHPPGAVPASTKGTVVLATLEGDVHDLGKNIVKMVLGANAYRVVDCGRDCPVERLVTTAEQEKPLAVGISGLITPVVPLVRQVKDLMRERGLGDIPVFAGGAALKQSSAERLNVDFLAQSAFDALHFLEPEDGASR